VSGRPGLQSCGVVAAYYPPKQLGAYTFSAEKNLSKVRCISVNSQPAITPDCLSQEETPWMPNRPPLR
jgi:hypothetical protein